jgi:hypothetical protein
LPLFERSAFGVGEDAGAEFENDALGRGGHDGKRAGV